MTVSESSLVIDEGTSETYTVVLDSQPTASVTVTVTVPAGTDVSVNNPSLAFTASDWSQAQTIEVSAADDDDALADATVILTHTVRGGDYIGASAADVEVTIVEDDTPTLSISDVRADEAVGEMVFAVTLSLASSNEVTVDYATSDGTAGAGSDYTAGAGTLTFAAGTTTAQAIRVPIVDDTVDEEEEETFAVTLRNAANAHLAGAAATLAVTGTITDNDDPAVTVAFAAGAYTATEGGTAATVTVRLSKDPERAVTIPIIDTPGGGVLATDYSGVPGSVAFAAGDTQKTFTVTAVDDAVDEDDERVTLGFGALPAGVMAGSPSTAVLTLADDDTRGVTLSETTLSVAEEDAAGAGYTVVLDSQPTGDVTVTVSGMAGTALTADPASLTFTSGDWSSAQTVTVSAAADANAVDETLVLSHTAAGGGYDDVPHETLSVTVDDDEAVSTAVTLSVVPAVVAEGAGTTSVTVTATLNGGTRDTPTVVAVVVGSKTATSGADFDAVGAFDVRIAADTPSGMETFTLMLVNDAVDESDETVEVSGSATGLATDLAVVGTELTITDDDTRGVTVSESSLVIDEGTSETYTVVLDSQPTASVTVDVTVPAGTDVSVNNPSLTFTALDWNQAQTVEVNAADDDDALADAEVILTHTVRGGDYIGASAADVQVTIVEDDTPALSISDVRADEAVGEMVFAVTLSLASSHEVTVDYATSNGTAGAGSDYTAGAGTLTFAAGTTTAQAIRVPIVDDTVDEEEEETFAVTLRNPANAHLAGAAATLAVTGTITDNDDPAVTVAFAAGAYTATEGGTAATVTVRLSTDPERTVAIPITDTPGGGVLATDYSGVPGSVTFAAGDTQKTFTVTAVDDAVDEDDERVTLGFGALPARVMAGSPSTAVLTLADDDTRGVTLSETTLSVAEEDAAGAGYTVVLDSQPTGDVTVTVSGMAGTALTADPASLTFTSGDWSSAQTVTVSAAADANAVDETLVLSHTAAGGGYDDVPHETLSVTVDDDEAVSTAVTLSVVPAVVAEGAGTTSVTVTATLNGGTRDTPTVVAVVVGSKTATSGADFDAVGAFDVRIAADTPSGMETFTLMLVNDAVDESDETVEVSGSATGLATDLAVVGTELTITDDDTRGVTVSESSLVIDEGTSETYTVVLDSQPTANVTVEVTVPAGTDVSVNQPSLTFTASDWSQAQTVEVSAAADDDALADAAVILTHTVRGGDYIGASAAGVEVTIVENDTPTLSVLDVRAGEAVGEMVFAVTLSLASSNEVTVDYATSDGTAGAGSDYTAGAGTLTFAAGTTTAQAIRVPIVDDTVDEEEEETFAVTLRNAANAHLAGAAATLTATGTITDNDDPAVTVAFVAGAYTATERGTAATVTVRLSTDPERTVAIPITDTPGSGVLATDYSGVPGSVTFAAGDTQKTFTVTAVDDAVDEDDERVTLGFGALPARVMAGSPSTAVLTLADDDTRGVTLSETTLSVAEEDAAGAGYTVVLDSQPTGDVTVTVSGMAGTALTADPASVTFTSGDWSSAQTVTVSAAADANAVDETLVLSHTAAGGGYDDVPHETLSVTVDDDEAVSTAVTLSVVPAVVAEGAGTTSVTVTATLNGGTRDTPTVVAVVVGSKTATSGADFDAVGAFDVRIAADTPSGMETFTLMPVNDAVDESDETVEVSGSATGLATDLAVVGTELTITDDDTRGVTVSESSLVIDEGTSETYTVVLDSQPTANVTVEVTVPAGTDVSVNQPSLTFTASDWSQAQTIEVSAADDDDALADATVILTHTVRGGDYIGASAAGVEVTIVENDTPTLSVLDVRAGEAVGEMVFAVTLSLASSNEVTVDYATSDGTAGAGSDYTAGAGTLTFAAGTTTAQAIRVPIVDDTVDEEEEETFAVTLRNPANAHLAGAAATLAVTGTITDNDDPAVTVAFAAGAYTATEGGTAATVTVRLSTDPERTVAIPIIDTPGSGVLATDYSGVPGSVTFAAGDTQKTFTVTAIDDAVDEDDERVTLGFGALPARVMAGSPSTAVLTLADDDTRGVTLSETTLSVAEEDAAGAGYTVVLDSQPTGDVTVTVSGMAGTALTADPASVTFTSGDWSSAQTVTVSAAADANAVDETLVLSHTAAGGGYDDVPHETLSVTVDDDEAVSTAVTLSVVPAVVAEGAGTTSVTVTATLNGGTRDTPTVVAVVVGSKTATSGADFDAVGAFDVRIAADTPSGMETFTLMPVNDAVDESDETVEVSGSATGLATDLAVVGTELTITDDDTRGVTLSETTLVIDEGTSGTYTVVLTSQPTASVTVDVTVPAGTDVSVNNPSLTFTASDWNQAQAIEVSAADDDDALADAAVILTHTVRGGDYIGASAAGVEVTIVEDDTPTLSISDVRAGEAVGEMAFAVTLSLASSNEVTVDYATSDGTAGAGSDYTAATGTLTFAAGTTTAQAIRVPIVDDTVDEEEEEAFAVTLRNPANAHLAGAAATLTVTGTITDNDDPAVTVAFAAGAYTATERGTAATVTVRLSTDPERTVAIPITDTPGSGVLATDYSGVPGSVAFAAGDTQKTFTVTAADDAVDEDDESVTLGFGALPAGVMAGSPSTAALTLADNDTRGVTLSETTLVIDEGTSGTYTVVLDSEPAGGVTVTPSLSSGDKAVTVSGALSFTADNWSTAQTVTVSAEQDPDSVDDAVVIGHAVAGGDYGANDVEAPDVSVTVDDDEPVLAAFTTVTLSVVPAVMAEDAGTTSVTVTARLHGGTRDTATVVVAVVAVTAGSKTATSETDFAPVGTFDVRIAADTLSGTGTFMLTPVNDAVDEADETVEVSGSATGLATDLATDLAVVGTELTIIDDDTRGVTVSESSLVIDEGTSETYTVVLDSEPTDDVTVTVTVPAGTDVSVNNPSLTFTASDWRQAQTVEVNAANDDDALADATVILTHTVGGGDYIDTSAADVEVTIVEDDTPALSISDVRAGEDVGEMVFAVTLSPVGSNEVTVDYATSNGTAGAGSDYTAATGTLTFATGTTTAQMIRVPIVDDTVDEEEEETFAVTLRNAANAHLAGAAATLAATGTIVDNDDPAVTVAFAAGAYTATEGGTAATVTVRLSTDPERAVTISITDTPGGGVLATDYSGVPGSVAFAAGDTQKTFTVTAADDAVDEDDERVTLGFGALPAGVMAGSPSTAVLTLADDDTRGVTLSETTLIIDEGTSGTYTVVLDSQPTVSVTVAVTVPVGTDVSVNRPSLTFTASDWRQAQTVEVSAADDDDALTDAEVILTHTVSGGDYIGESAADVQVTIVEDDTPALSVSDVRAGEDVGDMAFAVTLSLASSNEVTVDYATSNGTAGAGSDYTAATGTLTFATGTTTAQMIRVRIVDDTVDEEQEETFAVTLRNAANAHLAGGAATLAVTGTITDNDDPAVTVAFAAGAYTATEGGTAATVTVRLSKDPERTVAIPITHTPGGGVLAMDYSGVPGSVAFAVGDTQKTFTVTAADDAVDEDDESVTLGFGALPAGVMAGSPSTAVLTLADDDTRGVTLSETTLIIDEGTSGTYTVVLDSQPTASVTVDVTVPAGTDVSVNNPSLTFTASDWRQAQTIEVNAADDDDALTDAEVILTHTVSGGDYIGESAADVQVTIVEDDTPALSISDVRADEAVGEMVFAVTLSLASSHEVTVDYATSNGTAGAGSDYTAGAGTLTFAAGTTTAQAIRVPIVDDTVDEEEEETFAVTLRNPANAHLAGGAATLAATGAIVDNDDPAVTVAFAAGAYIATEGGSAATVTVRLSTDPERAVTIPITDTPGGGVLATDYSGVPGSVAFAAGDTEKTFTVTAVDDAVDEDDERVTLGFGALPARVMAGSPSTAALTLADDDTRGVTLSETTLVIDEGTSGTYTVVLDSEPAGGVTVTPSLSSGDKAVTVSGALSFTADNWSTAQTVTVSAEQDPDAVDNAAIIGHTVIGGDYGGVTAPDVSVRVDDDETAFLPAWLARFGRTAAEHVVEVVRGRLPARREAGLSGSLAGLVLGGAASAEHTAAARDIGDRIDTLAHGLETEPDGSARVQGMTGEEALARSAFTMTGESGGGGSLAVWGRGTRSGFERRGDALALDGDVTTLMLGMDYSGGPWLAGLALSHSRGEGGWSRDERHGEVEASVTGVYPYTGYHVTERLALWGAGGHGEGELTLRTPDETLRTDIAMSMAAAGVRGDLVTRDGSEGPALAVEVDGLYARTTSGAITGKMASKADVTRLRLSLEGSWEIALDGGTLLTPRIETGLRHDGGDAETGFGADIGGGFVFANPTGGLRAELFGRTLLVHEDTDVRDWGLSGSLVFDLEPSSQRGLMLSLRHARGAASSGGARALFDRKTMVDLGSGDSTSGGRLHAEAAYGLPAFGGAFVATPHAVLALTGSGREFRLGYRLRPASHNAPDMSLAIDGTQRDSDDDTPAEHIIALRFALRW